MLAGAQEGVLRVHFKLPSTNKSNSPVLAAGCLCGAAGWVCSARWILGYQAELLTESCVFKTGL